MPVDVIGFHKGEPQALGRHADAAEQSGGKSAIATPKIQRPERAVSHRRAMDMGQVGTYILLCFRRMLLKKGIRRCWMNGPQPLVAGGGRLVGPAFTLRFVPVREDLATPESWAKPISTRGAIEEMPAGCIAVADAMGVTSAGIFGDILTMRMMKRNVTALVTDGVVRDKAGVLASKLPVWCAGTAAPASVNGLTFVGWQEPIGCGGCAIFPGDVIVCDDDGAVVIPQDLLAFVAEEGAEHERMESFIVGEVERGAKLPGLYPMNADTKARYEAWKKK